MHLEIPLFRCCFILVLSSNGLCSVEIEPSAQVPGDLFTVSWLFWVFRHGKQAPLKGPVAGSRGFYEQSLCFSRQSGSCSGWWSIAVFVRCGIACWRLWAQYQWHILLLLFRNRAVVVYALLIMVTWKLHDMSRESIAIVKFLYHHFSCTVVREPLLRVESSFVCHSFH